jgi:hypothetical protein
LLQVFHLVSKLLVTIELILAALIRKSDVGSDHGNMIRTSGVDSYRLSIYF